MTLTTDQLARLAELALDAHGIDHLEYDDGTDHISCRSLPADRPTNRALLSSYGLVTTDNDVKLDAVDQFVYFTVDLAATLRIIPPLPETQLNMAAIDRLLAENEAALKAIRDHRPIVDYSKLGLDDVI